MAKIKWVALVLAAVAAAGLGGVKLIYGGGDSFPLPSDTAEVAAGEVRSVELDMPPGCITASPSGRIFFDTHPFAAVRRFDLPHVFELVDGEPVPWPGVEEQELFVAPFGLTADAQDRLWFIEPATLDRSTTRLLAFDLSKDELILDHELPAGVGRFAQDLRVSPDGRYVVLADTGAFRFTPGQLLVFDIADKSIVRTFEHESLDAQDWFIRRFDGDKHSVGWGLLTFQVGLDGLTFSADGQWLYYASMSHDSLYRLPTDSLLDLSMGSEALAAEIERVGGKPQSDGITVTARGDVLLTDVENGGITRLSASGERRTWTASADVIWADSVVVAPDGEVWFTDSAIPAYLQQSMAPPDLEVLTSLQPFHLHHFEQPDPDVGMDMLDR